VANVTNASLDYTPAPLALRALGVNSERNMTDAQRNSLGIPDWQDERTAKIVKAFAGTTAMVALLALGMGGGGGEGDEPVISGGGPIDFAANNQKRESGWRPYSIRFGNKYISYLPTSLSLPFAAVGNYVDDVRYGKLDEKSAGERLMKAIVGMGKTFTEQSFVSGIANLMDTVRGKKSASDFLASVATSAVLPNFFRQVDRTINPIMRQGDKGIVSKIQSAVPVWREQLPARPTVYGEPVASQPMSRFGQSATNDELAKVIEQKRAWVPEVSAGTKINGRLLTDDERRIVTEKSGPIIKRRLQIALPLLRTLSPQKANAYVDRIAREEHDKAKSRLPAQVRQNVSK